MLRENTSTLQRERIKSIRSIEKLLEGPMVFLGFLWLALLMLEFIVGLPATLEKLSIAIWIVFIVDFLLKIILAPHKVRFLKKNWLTVISLIVPAFRIFRLLRFLRFVRGVRVVKVVASLNRSMKSLTSTMTRRGFAYVATLTAVVTLGGAAGMFAIEKGHEGFTTYGLALWWTAMRIIIAGSDFWPVTNEGRILAFFLSLFGYAIFGYVTATLATFFIGRDAEEKKAPIAGMQDIDEIKELLEALNRKVDAIRNN